MNNLKTITDNKFSNILDMQISATHQDLVTLPSGAKFNRYEMFT